MATQLSYDLCPETGIGCVLLKREAGLLKLDLMPEEAAELKKLATAGDLAGVRALLTSVNAAKAAELSDELLKVLVQNVL